MPSICHNVSDCVYWPGVKHKEILTTALSMRCTFRYCKQKFPLAPRKIIENCMEGNSLFRSDHFRKYASSENALLRVCQKGHLPWNLQSKICHEPLDDADFRATNVLFTIHKLSYPPVDLISFDCTSFELILTSLPPTSRLWASLAPTSLISTSFHSTSLPLLSIYNHPNHEFQRQTQHQCGSRTTDTEDT